MEINKIADFFLKEQAKYLDQVKQIEKEFISVEKSLSVTKNKEFLESRRQILFWQMQVFLKCRHEHVLSRGEDKTPTLATERMELLQAIEAV